MPEVAWTPALIGKFVLFTFVACLGVLQIAAAHGRMVGLAFFKRPILGYLFGILAIGGMFWWFFTSGDRNVWNPRLEGAQLFGCFTLAGFCAIVFTLIVCSLLKGWRSRPSEELEEESSKGLEVLRRTTYFRVISRLFKRREERG